MAVPSPPRRGLCPPFLYRKGRFRAARGASIYLTVEATRAGFLDRKTPRYIHLCDFWGASMALSLKDKETDLNIGDCFSYALAMATDHPLLFKASDFAKMEVRAAMPSEGGAS